MTTTDKKNPVDLLNDPVPYALKKLTIPTVLGMILFMTFNIVDTFFVSMLGTEPLAAISFTFPVTFTLVSLTIGLSIGTTAVVGKALGKKDQESAKDLTTASMYLTAIIVGVLSFIGFIFMDELFLSLGATQELLPLIHEYMDIWFLGSVLLIGPMIGNAALRATGDTKTPSYIMGFAGLINAALDPLLIFGWGPVPALGLEGAAIATFISWIVGIVLGLHVLMNKKNLVHTKLISLKNFISSSKEVLTIGLPAAGATMLTPLAAGILTAIVAKFGAPAVAAFGVGARVEGIACLVLLALSMTLPAFISQNIGGLKMDRVKTAYKTVIKFVLFWQVLVYGVLVLTAPYISHIFTEDEEVSRIIELFIWIVPIGYGLQGTIILTNSSLNALHKPMFALVLSIFRLFVFYIPFAYLGSLFYGLTGFFVGCVVGNLFMALTSYLLMKKYFKSEEFDTSEEPAV